MTPVGSQGSTGVRNEIRTDAAIDRSDRSQYVPEVIGRVGRSAGRYRRHEAILPGNPNARPPLSRERELSFR